MNYYIIIFFILIIFFIENKYKVYNVLSFISLLIISYLRYNVGTDYFSYYQIYNTITTYYKNNAPLFYYLMIFSKKLNFEYSTFLLINSGIYLLIIFYLIKKKVELQYQWVGMFFFLVIYENYFGSLSAIRQATAIALVTFSLCFDKNKVLIKLLLIIIATMFHKSAIIFIIFLFFKFPKKLILIKIIFILFFILFIFFNNEIFIILNKIFIILNLKNYSGYLKISNFNFTIRNILKFFYSIFYIIQLYYFNKIYKKFLINRSYIFYIILGLMLNIFILTGFIILHRYIAYFYIFYIFVMPKIYKNSKKIFRVLIIIVFFINFIINHLKFIYGDNSKFMSNYTFILFKDNKQIEEDFLFYLEFNKKMKGREKL